LPWEAEWEYACRAKTTTLFWSGDSADSLKGVDNIFAASCKAKSGAEFARLETDLANAFLKAKLSAEDVKLRISATWDDGYPFTAPVGKFKPNPWGLYDMHGNFRQWCQDRYGAYEEGYQKDLKGIPNGNNRVLRGGSWHDNPLFTRAAHRCGCAPGDRDGESGFRVVAVVPRTP
jgi:formylglycine-generating enzyme required for sulfatase activity